jgi:hypothetical protein
MRFYIIPCLLAAAILAGCKNNSGNGAGPATNNVLKDTAQFTTIQWLDSTSKDFGKIQEGQQLEVTFRFKNTGDKPLIIQKVQPSCGCTIADQPKEPIAPGAEGLIRANFNSTHHTGINHKTLFVFANTKGSTAHSLQFMVEVTPAEKKS